MEIRIKVYLLCPVGLLGTIFNHDGNFTPLP